MNSNLLASYIKDFFNPFQVEVGDYRLFDPNAFQQSLNIHQKQRRKGDYSALPPSQRGFRLRDVLTKIPGEVKRFCTIL
jgi:hypothetical protein